MTESMRSRAPEAGTAPGEWRRSARRLAGALASGSGRLAGATMDWIFGPQCAACGAPATTLCEACRGSLVELGPACLRCAEPTAEDGATCARCRRDRLSLDGVAAPWRFGGQLA